MFVGDFTLRAELVDFLGLEVALRGEDESKLFAWFAFCGLADGVELILGELVVEQGAGDRLLGFTEDVTNEGVFGALRDFGRDDFSVVDAKELVEGYFGDVGEDAVVVVRVEVGAHYLPAFGWRIFEMALRSSCASRAASAMVPP